MDLIYKWFFIEKVYAEDLPGGEVGGYSIKNPLKVDTVQELLAIVLQAVVQLSVPLIVLAIIYVGFLFVTAQGRDDQLKKARQALFWTIIGAGIILGAFVISEVISNTVGNLESAS